MIDSGKKRCNLPRILSTGGRSSTNFQSQNEDFFQFYNWPLKLNVGHIQYTNDHKTLTWVLDSFAGIIAKVNEFFCYEINELRTYKLFFFLQMHMVFI